MATLQDLDRAILDVLSNATYEEDFERAYYVIKPEKLQVLQAEYNIHFVEPDQAQLSEIE